MIIRVMILPQFLRSKSVVATADLPLPASSMVSYPLSRTRLRPILLRSRRSVSDQLCTLLHIASTHIPPNTAYLPEEIKNRYDRRPPERRLGIYPTD